MFAFGMDPEYNDMALDPLQTETNICLFAQRVKKMLPAVKELGVDIEQNIREGSKPPFGRFVSHLLRSIGHINLDLTMDFSRHNELQLDWICNLT
ncbi:hypothetical protein IWW38_003391, partial [Coemansia aciculifera]